MNEMTPALTTEFTMEFISVYGLNIRYTRTENPGKETVVLLSPWPESVYAWWPAWQYLKDSFDLVAIDLPGFGQSESRRDLMGPEAMGSFIPKILFALGIHHPHVVGPDVGTSALLFTAARHPSSVASIVIGGGAASFPLMATGLLQQFIEAPSLEPFKALDTAEVAGGAVKRIPGYEAPGFVVEDYIESYAGTRFVDSIQYVQSYPKDLQVLAPLLPEIKTPVFILAARNDTYLSLADPENLAEKLPRGELTILENSHNAWEESPRAYAAEISTWVGRQSAP